MSPLERAGFLAHAQTAIFQRRLTDAAALLAAHPDYAVSISWGKDSIAVLQLAAGVFPSVIAVNGRYGDDERLPDTDAVRDAILSTLPNIRYVEVRAPGEREMYRRAGGFFMDPVTPTQKEAVRWWKTEFLRVMQSARTSAGAAGVFLGLRAEESRARALNLYVHGDSYTKRDGEGVSLPVGRWSGRDIWALLATHNLPCLRMYDVAWDRIRARSDFVFATGGAGSTWRHGAWQDWRAAYPELFASWLDEFPEMARYC